MRKKWLLVVGAVMLVAILATAAFAANPVKLIVNCREIKPDVAPQIINGRTMVPVSWVAEALGAKVKWEAETRSVVIYTYISASDSLSRQITLLQDALAPTAPGEAVEKWAKGIKERNGALQYAVLSPELKKQKLSDYEHVGWVTGVSSPWVENFKILKETKINEASWEYKIQFNWATSSGPAKPTEVNLTVKQDGQNWYISQVFNGAGLTEPGQLKTVQFQKEIKIFLARQYKHYQVLETEIALLSQKVNNSFGEAEFKTKVTTLLGCKTPAEWPVQKGRIKYLAENRQNLIPEQIKKVEKEIDFWNKELQEYIEKPSDANDFLKITAEFDKQGMLKKNTVKIYSQDPMGEYLPVEEKNNSMFKTAEELVAQGYEEMRELCR
jgi:hypothetical protein